MHDLHRWVERDDIIALIRALGFDDVRVAHDEPDHGHDDDAVARRSAGILSGPMDAMLGQGDKLVVLLELPLGSIVHGSSSSSNPKNRAVAPTAPRCL